MTYWIDKYDYIADQEFGDWVLAPPVTDNIAIESLTFGDTVDLKAPVLNDFTVTWVATDFVGNNNSCEISVRVKRK